MSRRAFTMDSPKVAKARRAQQGHDVRVCAAVGRPRVLAPREVGGRPNPNAGGFVVTPIGGTCRTRRSQRLARATTASTPNHRAFADRSRTRVDRCRARATARFAAGCWRIYTARCARPKWRDAKVYL